MNNNNNNGFYRLSFQDQFFLETRTLIDDWQLYLQSNNLPILLEEYNAVDCAFINSIIQDRSVSFTRSKRILEEWILSRTK